jgi:hypothetical protein
LLQVDYSRGFDNLTPILSFPLEGGRDKGLQRSKIEYSAVLLDEDRIISMQWIESSAPSPLKGEGIKVHRDQKSNIQPFSLLRTGSYRCNGLKVLLLPP